MQGTSQLFSTEDGGCHISSLTILLNDHKLNARQLTSSYRVSENTEKMYTLESTRIDIFMVLLSCSKNETLTDW